MNNNYSTNMINNLMQRKSLIEQEIQALQTPQAFTPQYAPPQYVNYDFNGKYVNGYEEAIKVSDNEKQVILMDRNEPKFYMKAADNSLHTYEFKEVEHTSELDELKKIVEQQANEIKALKGETTNEPTIQTSSEPNGKQY